MKRIIFEKNGFHGFEIKIANRYVGVILPIFGAQHKVVAWRVKFGHINTTAEFPKLETAKGFTQLHLRDWMGKQPRYASLSL